jgi:hypothetical protein
MNHLPACMARQRPSDGEWAVTIDNPVSRRKPLGCSWRFAAGRRVQASQKLLEGQRDVSSIGGWRLSWTRPAAVLRVAPVAGCSITNPKVLRNEYRR